MRILLRAASCSCLFVVIIVERKRFSSSLREGFPNRNIKVHSSFHEDSRAWRVHRRVSSLGGQDRGVLFNNNYCPFHFCILCRSRFHQVMKVNTTSVCPFVHQNHRSKSRPRVPSPYRIFPKLAISLLLRITIISSSNPQFSIFSINCRQSSIQSQSYS